MHAANELDQVELLEAERALGVDPVHQDETRAPAIKQKYALDMPVDSVQALCERFGLTFPAV
ncbi:hypothetical protein [Luteitalea sp.]|uniref:hypothetical protein n=1 Tax=Luteitalea sp. TaxID=2004800 RepID=UPI0025C15C77|nr:hypothetical protein [Luteitalea sp.]